MKGNATFLVLLAIFAQTQAECPQLRDIPIMYGDTNTFTCARVYMGKSGNYLVNSCNKCNSGGAELNYFEVNDGYDADAGEGKLYPMDTILVKPGCELVGYSESNYGGEYQEFKEGIHLNAGHEMGQGDCGNGWRSFRCRCQDLTPVNCEATDRFDVVLQCDAMGSSSPVKCDYKKQVGVVYSDELSTSVHVGLAVEFEISAAMMEVFSVSLGESASTGFDWTATSTSTRKQVKTISVNAEAPAGLFLTIEQAVGTCGGSTVKTELFRIRHTDSNGDIVHEGFETM